MYETDRSSTAGAVERVKGRKGGNCQKTCEKFRPSYLDSKW